MADKFLQSNKPTGRLGEARQSGNRAVAAKLAVLSRCTSIFLITAGSSPRVGDVVLAIGNAFEVQRDSEIFEPYATLIQQPPLR